MGKSSKIGLRDIKFAWLNTGTDTVAVPAAYTMESTSVLESIKVSISRKGGDPDPQYAEDIESDVLYPDPEIDITLESKEIPLALQQKMFAQAVKDANGVYSFESGKTPVYFALGFKAAKRDGTDRWVWQYKCRATPLDQTYHTKEGTKVTRQTDSLKITSIKRTYDKYVSAKVDSDTAGGPNAAAFFTGVYEPTFTP